MSGETTAGSKLFIGPAVAEPHDATAQSLDALTPYVEIDRLMDLNELGDTANDVTASYVNRNRVHHSKGQYDGGSSTFIFGRDYTDPGQAAMRAAFRSRSNFAFKLTREGDTTESFFVGLVMGVRETYSQADSIMQVTFTVTVNSEVFNVTG